MAIYALKHPVQFGKVNLDKLTLRDHVIAEDYLAFDQRGGVAQRLALIASVAGTDEQLIRRLHGVDYLALERMVDKLLSAADVESIGDEPKTSPDGKVLDDQTKK